MISDKIDFKMKTGTRDKEGHYILIKGSIQEDITIIHSSNKRAPLYIRQMLASFKRKRQKYSSREGSSYLTHSHRSSRQKINKEKQALNDTFDQMDLIDIYRAFHRKTITFTFFSSSHKTFPKIDDILGHNQAFVSFKKIEIFQASSLTTML